VKETEYGAVVTAAPIATPFWKKATLVTVAPVLAVALAVSVTAVPTAPVALLAGAESATVGIAGTVVTVIAVDRVWLPLSSTASARMVCALAAVGVQLTE